MLEHGTKVFTKPQMQAEWVRLHNRKIFKLESSQVSTDNNTGDIEVTMMITVLKKEIKLDGKEAFVELYVHARHDQARLDTMTAQTIRRYKAELAPLFV